MPAPLRSVAPMLLWCAAAAIVAATHPGMHTADAADLVPPAERAAPGTYVLLHRHGAGDDVWARVADTLGPLLPDHAPLAPPPAEARAWHDAHLLWWVDAAAETALAQKFEPTALRAAIAGIRARLASPLFGVGGDAVRRDPLGLADLSGMHAPPQVTATASGDLLSADGNTLLVHVRTAGAPEAVATSTRDRLHGQFAGDAPDVASIEVHAVTLERPAATPTPIRWISANLALLTLMLALGARRLRWSLTIVAVLTTGAMLLPFITGPLALTLLGAAAAMAVRPNTQAAPFAWTHLTAALLPLLLLPYPLWQREALVWPLATVVLWFGVLFVAPAALAVLRARPPADTQVPRTVPPTAALLACAALLAAGTWSIGQVPCASIVDATPTALTGLLDTARVATLRSRGETPADALAAAARDAHAITLAVPGARLDGPGQFVLDEQTLDHRSEVLAAIDLPGRVEFLRAALAEQGLRPDAFAEFFGALDPLRQPSPDAALLGPLGPWLAASLGPGDDGVVATTRVHLPAQLPDTLPTSLHGPAVFAHREHHEFTGHLALALIAGAWLSAFLTWLSARRLGPALTAAIVGAAAQLGALATVAAIHGEISPLLLPALLVVGALPALSQPTTAARASACLAAPGLVLLTGDDPSWHAYGLALAVGAALAGLLTAHAGPHLCALLPRREATR